MIEKEFRYTVEEFSAQLFEMNNILKIIPLSAGISLSLDFGLWKLLDGMVLHMGAWVATLLGTPWGPGQIKVKVKFLCTV